MSREASLTALVFPSGPRYPPGMPDHVHHAALFDMDGTLLNSIAAAERVWSRWAVRHGIDVATFLPTIHGVRAVETIRAQHLPSVDAEAEAAALTRDEIADVDGIVPIAGAAALLAALPADRVAIVTSAPRALAERRLAAAGLAAPALLICAEDVAQGKPAPDCYRVAAARLGVAPTRCVVFEDAAAGIAAAEAAGCAVIVVTATHPAPMATPHPAIASYERVNVALTDDGFVLSRA